MQWCRLICINPFHPTEHFCPFPASITEKVDCAEIDSVPLIVLRGVILAGEELFDRVARLSSTHRRPTMVPKSIKVGRRCYELLDKTGKRNATWTSSQENLQVTDNCQLRIIGRDHSVRQAERTRVRPWLLFCIMDYFLASRHMNSCTLALYTGLLDFILVFLHMHYSCFCSSRPNVRIWEHQSPCLRLMHDFRLILTLPVWSWWWSYNVHCSHTHHPTGSGIQTEL